MSDVKVKFGILHNHTENSVRDSAMHVYELVDAARKIGAPAVALTDHGNLMGVFDFMKACAGEKDKDGKVVVPAIKGIPGVESYFMPDRNNDENKEKRHIILMAKDADGYKTLSKAVSESEEHKVAEFPRMDYQLLEKYFGPCSAGHGRVIATSACVHGILGSILLSNEVIDKKIRKVQKRMDNYQPVDDEFLDLIEQEEKLDNEVNELKDWRDERKKDTKVTVTGLKRRLKTLTVGSEEYNALEQQIEDAQKARDEAIADVERIKQELAKKKAQKTEFGKSIKAQKESAKKWSACFDAIEKLESEKRSDEDLMAEVETAILRFVEIFGEGNFFIELQYHGLSIEADVMPKLAEAAVKLNVPVVAANDAHYATSDPDDSRARELVCAMRFKQEAVFSGEGYGQLYLKTDDELTRSLQMILKPEIVQDAMENVGVIVDACNVEFTHGTHYPLFKGGLDGETTTERLRRLSREAIEKKYGEDWCELHEQRIEYELEQIDKFGYSDYLCIVQDFLAYGKQLAVENPEKIGYTIGPGRGSAAGSLVAYLTGITEIDPIRYGLLFERFINPERVSMPDIDSDFHTEIRELVVEYCRKKYGQRAVVNIATKSRMAGKSAIRFAGKAIGAADGLIDQVARMIPTMPNAKISDGVGLEELCQSNQAVAELVRNAKLIEGVLSSFGTHAAGIIISDTEDATDYVPMMFVASDNKEGATGTWSAQCDMGEAEFDAGLLKMDFLGLRNLDIIDDTLKRIWRNHGIRLDIEKAPHEAAVFSEIFASGKTNSIFQFESGGMKSMLRSFRPSSMDDLILLVAAYRPGPMQYLDEIISNKHGRTKPKYITDALKPILEATYGKPIYQEQVMQICNQVAGFSLGEADIVRRAMGKKKLSILTDPRTDYQGKFIRGLISSGASEQDAKDFWDSLLEFANYAFNKSHAACYAHIAYYTAWLKYHYPAEFMCSVMMRVGSNKLPALLGECKKMGLEIKAPEINDSSINFTNQGDTILFGFNNVSGVGNAGDLIVEERLLSGKFNSVKDFTRRMFGSSTKSINKNVAINLIQAGAFDAFCGSNRASVLVHYEDLIEAVKTLSAKTEACIEKSRRLSELESAAAGNDKVVFIKSSDKSRSERVPTEKDIRAAQKGAVDSKAAMQAAQAAVVEIIFTPCPEDRKVKLDNERERLGVYVSGHPLEEYREAIAEIARVKPIDEVGDEGYVTVCGVATNVVYKARKSDGMPMAFFELIDQSGEIQIKCFTKTYAKYGDIIVEGAVITLSGKVMVEKSVGDDGIETITDKGIAAETIKLLEAKESQKLLVCIKTMADWMAVHEKLKKFEHASGCECHVVDLLTKKMRKCQFRVSSKIIEAEPEGVVITKM